MAWDIVYSSKSETYERHTGTQKRVSHSVQPHTSMAVDQAFPREFQAAEHRYVVTTTAVNRHLSAVCPKCPDLGFQYVGVCSLMATVHFPW